MFIYVLSRHEINLGREDSPPSTNPFLATEYCTWLKSHPAIPVDFNSLFSARVAYGSRSEYTFMAPLGMGLYQNFPGFIMGRIWAVWSIIVLIMLEPTEASMAKLEVSATSYLIFCKILRIINITIFFRNQITKPFRMLAS